MSNLLLAEAKTKTVDGVKYGPGDFLVVEDDGKPSTWHLPVKKDGKPDHKLMGAAHAALTKGYRGQKYSGPNKAEALKKLKALYKAEEMDWPMAESDTPDPVAAGRDGEASLAEHYGEGPYTLDDQPYVPWGAKSFADLAAAEDAKESALQIRRLAHQFKSLVENVLGDSAIAPKLPAIQTVANEFIELVAVALGEVTQPAGEAEVAEVALAEAEAGAVLALVAEDDAPTPKSARDPLLLDVVLIQPGFGNKKDNHYYPKETLARDAKVFEGAKMYTTDHKEGEKSERTEVSQIERITGFAESGAPIARVVVFDPDFAEKTRNRGRAGTLDSLHCSILASGRARRGTIDGQGANIIEAITAAQSVDWVTKAGAGGHALRLAETGDQIMTPETPATPPAFTAPVAPVVPVAETQTTQPVTQPVQLQESAAPATETPAQGLAEADVKAKLAEQKLPAAVQLRLAERQYADAAALDAAISAEIAYLKEVTGSGKPLTFAEVAPAAPLSTRAREQNVRRVLARYS